MVERCALQTNGADSNVDDSWTNQIASLMNNIVKQLVFDKPTSKTPHYICDETKLIKSPIHYSIHNTHVLLCGPNLHKTRNNTQMMKNMEIWQPPSHTIIF
ncbi:hypothetical protein CIPAW_11G178100 [Carya illinoinensis]|uniref:Uncharacterized protein n=1 Tax=Carya illinoinensis TaxID=32201 RepID=A0A8T1P5B8_CARIL|nr:hypothetical protein CIPAW_11G178100 [Carya illinoinensis]